MDDIRSQAAEALLSIGERKPRERTFSVEVKGAQAETERLKKVIEEAFGDSIGSLSKSMELVGRKLSAGFAEGTRHRVEPVYFPWATVGIDPGEDDKAIGTFISKDEVLLG